MHHRFPKFSLDAAQAVNLCGIIYAVRADHVSFSKNVAKYRMNNALYFNVNIYTYETKKTARKGAVKRNFKASKRKARSKKSLR